MGFMVISSVMMVLWKAHAITGEIAAKMMKGRLEMMPVQLNALDRAREIIAASVAEGRPFRAAMRRLHTEPDLLETLNGAPPIFRIAKARLASLGKWHRRLERPR